MITENQWEVSFSSIDTNNANSFHLMLKFLLTILENCKNNNNRPNNNNNRLLIIIILSSYQPTSSAVRSWSISMIVSIFKSGWSEGVNNQRRITTEYSAEPSAADLNFLIYKAASDLVGPHPSRWLKIAEHVKRWHRSSS